jgi:hypothetical protein
MNAQRMEAMENRNLEIGNLKNGAAMSSVLTFQFFDIGICLDFSAYDLVLRRSAFFPAGSSGKSLVSFRKHLASFRRPLVSFGSRMGALWYRYLPSKPTKNRISTPKTHILALPLPRGSTPKGGGGLFAMIYKPETTNSELFSVRLAASASDTSRYSSAYWR